MRALCGMAAGFLLTFGALQSAADGGSQTRSLDRFHVDPVVNPGWWSEVAVSLDSDTDSFQRQSVGADGRLEVDEMGMPVLDNIDDELEIIRVEPRLAYGREWFEAGLFLPILLVEQRERDTDLDRLVGSANRSEGLGDLSAYGKFVAPLNDFVRLGGGLQVSAPTGNERALRGFGQFGFMPFVTGALAYASAEVRFHFGYRAFTNPNGEPGSSNPANEFEFGGGLFYDFSKWAGVRLEVVGTEVRERDEIDRVTLQPGFDIRLQRDYFDIVLRPTGGVGLTDDAADWRIGGALALRWHGQTGVLE